MSGHVPRAALGWPVFFPKLRAAHTAGRPQPARRGFSAPRRPDPTGTPVGTNFQEGALHCRHVLVGKAEFDSMESELTRQAELLTERAEELERLRRAIHDHRTATLLATHEVDLSEADNRLWGVLE